LWLAASTGVSQLPTDQRAPRTNAETILLVDDDDSVRGLIQTVLLERGYTVLVASSGWDALRLAQEHGGKIDLLVTDVIMPGMDGPELAETFASLRAEMRVLFVSGYTADALNASRFPAHPARLLPKPFSPGELAHRVREVLDADRPASQGV
jgi:two-component system cell cycle sensor histidine kinase/response regulator CckA